MQTFDEFGRAHKPLAVLLIADLARVSQILDI